MRKALGCCRDNYGRLRDQNKWSGGVESVACSVDWKLKLLSNLVSFVN